MRRLTIPQRLLCLAAALWLLPVSGCGQAESRAYPGYAEGDYVRLASPLAGTLARIDVRRGDQAVAGAPAYVLEQASETAARGEAQSRAERAEALLADLRKGARSDELAAIGAELRAAQAALALSQTNLERSRKLVQQGFIAPAQLDEARAEVDAGRARVDQVAARLRTARTSARSDQIAAAARELDAARAQLAQAQWRVDQKVRSVPVGGVVTDVLYRVGEFVPAGSPIVSLLPPAHLKARFFVPEARLGTIKLGQPVTLACDGCAATLRARISFIAPEAEFTAPLIYSNENRANLVFMVEARPEAGQRVVLHPGQPLTVTP